MHAEFVTTSDDGLLRSVRSALEDAERALICVAFVREGGVRLISRELEALKSRRADVRLLVTTAFDSTTTAALDEARRLGVDVGVLNQKRGTYHPKVYLGLKGDRCRAVIGSANLTGGLAANIEAATFFEGLPREPVLDQAWRWADALWDSGEPVVEYWDSTTRRRPVLVPPREVLEPELFDALSREVRRDPVFLTLGDRPRPNRVTAVAPEAVYVETEKSRAERRPPQPVEAWMLNLAWSYLRTHGTLSNTKLLNALRVHRSSAVCAMLARLPSVVVEPGRGITLRWIGTAVA